MSRYFQDFAYNHILDQRGVLCKRIKEYIEKHFSGSTYREIAEEVHVSAATIGNIYNMNYMKLSLIMLIMVAMRLGVNHRV